MLAHGIHHRLSLLADVLKQIFDGCEIRLGTLSEAYTTCILGELLESAALFVQGRDGSLSVGFADKR